MNVFSALKSSPQAARSFIVIGMFWGCFATNIPVIKGNLGAGDALFGQLMLGSAVGLVSAMWLAPLLDRRAGDRGMQIGAVLFALAWLLPGLVTSPLAFALSIMLAGIGSGLLDIIMNARVSEAEARTGRSMMNVFHGVFSLAYGVSALICGFAREAGFSPFAMLAILTLISLFLVPSLRLAPAMSDSEQATHKTGAIWGAVLLCGAVTLIAFMSEASVEIWSALFIERDLGGRAVEGALGPFMLGATMALGRFSGQALSDRFGDLKLVAGAAVLAASGALIAATAPVAMQAYVGFGVLGLGVSVIGPIGLSLVGKRVSDRDRVTAISRVAAIGFSGFFIAPFVMGLSAEYLGLRWSYGAVSAVLLMVLPFVWVLRR